MKSLSKLVLMDDYVMRQVDNDLHSATVNLTKLISYTPRLSKKFGVKRLPIGKSTVNSYCPKVKKEETHLLLVKALKRFRKSMCCYHCKKFCQLEYKTMVI